MLHFEDLKLSATAGKIETMPMELATRSRVQAWRAAKGEKLTVMLPVEREGKREIKFVVLHQPDGASLRASIAGKALPLTNGQAVAKLKTAYVPRNLNVHFKPVELSKGKHALVLECVEPGFVGLDFIWMK
jgi:hypothetical protein